MIHLHAMRSCVELHTRVSPSGARGSVIQEPNLDPDVLMVMGSLIPVSLPHAARKEVKWEHLEQNLFWYLDYFKIYYKRFIFIYVKSKLARLKDEGVDVQLAAMSLMPFSLCDVVHKDVYYSIHTY